MKIKNSIKELWVKAAVMAVPINGAEQGVAKRVAKKPLKKFFAKKLFFLLIKLELLIENGIPNSNNPSVFSEKIVNTTKINNKKYGSWNCMPHDTEILSCIRIMKNKANNKNENIIPRTV